jgi:hypothetical protein
VCNRGTFLHSGSMGVCTIYSHFNLMPYGTTVACYRYAEYQYVCSTEQIEAKQCFGDIDMFQLFDLVPVPVHLLNTCALLLHVMLHGLSSDVSLGVGQTVDPYELKNVYNQTAPAIRDALAKRLRTYYPCAGSSCP